MSLINEKMLSLIKFQAEQILFRHNQSRLVYRYFDTLQDARQHPNITHDTLFRGHLFSKGVIYIKQQSNLEQQISRRSRSRHSEQLNQEELINTFTPLFQCLMHLHENNIVHGSIHLQNIVIQNEEIMLRDWLAPTKLNTQYYPEGSISMDDDIQALGRCLLSCIRLDVNQAKEQIKIQQWIDKYSKFIIAIVIILTDNLKSYYKSIVHLLQGQAKYIDGYLKKKYQELKKSKEIIKSKEIVENKSAENLNLSINKYKKVPGNHHKKEIQSQNIENKSQVVVQTKRSQKVTKDVQKSHIVQQLMNKKLNEEEKKVKESSLKRPINKSNIINVSNFGIENTIKKRNYRERNSPGHIVRQFSKKK